MSLTLSGTLLNPYGDPLPNATIRFDAIRNTPTVLRYVSAEATTDNSGSYTIDVEHGNYNIFVRVSGRYLDIARGVVIGPDTTSTDLNELVVEQQDATPEIVAEFRQLVAAARTARDQAQDAASSAGGSAQDAAADRHQVEQIAQSVGSTAGSIEQIAQQVSADATQASESASDAAAAKEAAEQALGGFDILIADVERRQFEAATGGACTIERNTAGEACHMFILPRMTWEDLVPSGELGTGTHEAFLVDGTEKSELLIGMYGAARGPSGTLVSQPGLAPRLSINWDNSRADAQAAGFGLMSNWEWSAIAFWCMANGFQPRGNTGNGQSHSHPHERGVLGVDSVSNIATGSGPNTWRHNGAPNGIADLVGNLWEWQWGFKMVDGRIFLAPDNYKARVESEWVDTEWDMPSALSSNWANFYNSENEAPLDVRRALIMPNGVADPDGSMWTNLEGERFPSRGGTRFHAGNAGLGALYLSDERTFAFNSRGLRLSRLV